jgi:MYXO-CTERM domain-containing protein
MRRLIVAGTLSLFGMGMIGCGGETTSEGPAAPEDPTRVDRQAQSMEVDRDHWFVGGADSQGEILDAKGNPGTATAQFVNGGAGVNFASLGAKGWLVASANGTVQLLDASGMRTGESRQALQNTGGDVNCLSRGQDNWMVGGSDGTVQLIDRNGQPTGLTKKPFGSTPIGGVAYGDGQWLVASESGDVIRLGASQLNEQANAGTIPGSPAVVGIDRLSDQWAVVTEDGVAMVDNGGAGSVTQLTSSATITAYRADGDTLAVGADDGGVYVAGADQIGSASWTNALGQNAVRDIVKSGSEWLVVGDAGQARLLDDTGSPTGSAETLADGNTISGARATSDGWMIAIADLSAVQAVGGGLESSYSDSDLLGGADILDLAAGGTTMLAVGGGGKYRVLKPDGTPETEVKTAGGLSTLTAVEWNGENYLVGDEGGKVATVDEAGELGTPKTFFGGDEIRSISWSSRFFLMVSADGTYQRLRKDGSAYKNAQTTELTAAREARYNGDSWTIVGSKNGKGAFAMINEDGSKIQGATALPEIDGMLHAAGWNGREWLLGGDGGMIARIDQSGSLINQGDEKGIRNALYGFTVREINFNGDDYLLAGQYGAVRQLEFDSRPLRPAVATSGFRDVYALEWANTRGFPGGPCVSNEFCLRGSCVGGVSEGFCCETACDGPCESCYSEDTDKPDGICSPVPAGQKPPERKQRAGNGCIAGTEMNCGKTGMCDGQGQCQYFGSDVQCQAPSCSQGEATPAGQCNGGGSCEVGQSVECRPYKGCDGNTCLDSCQSDMDCVPGFGCKDGECIDRKELNGDADAGGMSGGASGGSGGGSDDGGCSMAAGDRPTGGFWLGVVALGAIFVRRRR